MLKAYWVNEFKDLPVIPECKRWILGGKTTLEQQILFKLLNGQPITKDEERLFNESIEFYSTVTLQLSNTKLQSFTEEERFEYFGYVNYVFSHLMLLSNNVTCWNICRVVKNKSVLGEEKSIPHVSLLSYPSKEIVKRIGQYNRANSPDYNVFYGAQTVNAALLETKPAIGDLITVSVWGNTNPEMEILSYPINHGKEAIMINADVRKGYTAFQAIKKKNHPLLMKMMEIIFDFLGEEFSKQAHHHLDYFFSAFYSQRIFENVDIPDWNYEAIIYPSVQNKFKYENLAIKPEVFDKRFRIRKIMEMVVDESYYDLDLPLSDLLSISYIKPRYIREPSKLNADNSIEW